MRTLTLLAAFAVWVACGTSAHSNQDDLLAEQLYESSKQCKLAADAKDLTQAKLYCNRANSIKPLPENYVNLGSALYTHGYYKNAETYFVGAVNINPKLAVAHFNLGRVYEVLGKSKDAHEQYQEAARLGDADAAIEIAAQNTVAVVTPKR
jgi:tetratricopeptide (TPR) repeat protein